MDNKNNNIKFSALIGLGLFALGAVTGYLSKQYIVEKVPVDADGILNNVKNTFKQTGEIEGAWIELTPVAYEIPPHKTDVFKGGISRIEDSELVQYQFIADAYSGTIIDIKTLNS